MEGDMDMESAWPFAVQKWGVRLSALPAASLPPPKPGAGFHPAAFVVPAALSAAAVAHGVLCRRRTTQPPLREKARERAAF